MRKPFHRVENTVSLKFLAAVFAGLFLTVSLRAEPSAPFRVYTEDSPPGETLDASGNAAGPMVELIKTIMADGGITGSIEVLPWKRAYSYGLSGPRAAVFETTRTPEREPLFRWVGPVKRIRWQFFAKADSAIKLRSLEDAKHADGVIVYAGDSKGDFLKEQGFTNLMEPRTPEQSARMLMAGRAPLWMFSDIGLAGALKAAGFSPKDVKPVLDSKVQDLYIALSKDVGDHDVQAWTRGLRQVEADGTMERLYRGVYPPSVAAELAAEGPRP